MERLDSSSQARYHTLCKTGHRAFADEDRSSAERDAAAPLAPFRKLPTHRLDGLPNSLCPFSRLLLALDPAATFQSAGLSCYGCNVRNVRWGRCKSPLMVGRWRRQVSHFPREKAKSPHPGLGRRAVLVPMLASMFSLQPLPLLASDVNLNSKRIMNQDVLDPEYSTSGSGLFKVYWNGRYRCDPQDPLCRDGGRLASGLDVQPVPSDRKNVTDRVRLGLEIGRGETGVLNVGLWGDAAPDAVGAFVKISKGKWRPEADEIPATYEGSPLVKLKRNSSITFGIGEEGGSTVIVRGSTRPVRVPCRPPKTADPENGVSHDAAGLISVPKNGGTYEFQITTRANPSLDKDYMVIGSLLDAASMQVLERLNGIPVNGYTSAPQLRVNVDSVSVS